MTPRTLVGTYKCCGGTLWATILKMEAEISSERGYLSTKLHGLYIPTKSHFLQPVPAYKGFHDFFHSTS
jgi:hypothetical protein